MSLTLYYHPLASYSWRLCGDPGAVLCQHSATDPRRLPPLERVF
jgi:hypothetical protein